MTKRRRPAVMDYFDPNRWHLIFLGGCRFPVQQTPGRVRPLDLQKAVTYYRAIGFSETTAEHMVARHRREARRGAEC